MLCPNCLLELGARKTALARHRTQCVFGEGTPWGAWQARLEWWVRQEERATADAYANAARVLFYRRVQPGNTVHIDLLYKGLAADLEQAASNHGHLLRCMKEMPPGPQGSVQIERVREHGTTVQILANRIQELKQMTALLESP